MTLFGRRRVVVEVIAVGVVYYAAARLALLMQLPGTNADAIWPPSGIGLGAMLLWGTRVWPGVAAAAFLAALSTVPATPAGLVASTLIAGANALELIVACAIIRRVSGSDNPFERAGYALGFVSATVVAAFIHATVDVTSFNLTGVIDSSMNRATWLTSLVGDAAGMIVLAPAIYAWGRTPRLRLSFPRQCELLAMMVATLLLGEMVFGRWGNVLMALTRPFQPVLLWAAFRFGQRETSTLALIVCVQAVSHTWTAMKIPGSTTAGSAIGALLLGSSAAPQDWLRAIQFFICTTVVLALIVSAAIAERDQSRRDLGESERRFRTIFEQAAVGVALVDASTGRFLRVNQRYADILGYTPEQMLGITFREITHPDDLDSDVAHLQRLNAGEQTRFTMEKRYRARDGSFVWVNLTMSPMIPEDPGSGHIAIVEDITARKRAEFELRDINLTLEERVHERTAWMETANRQLAGQIHDRLDAEMQLRASLEEKETLLREVHHRVKNNLSVVSSLLYLEADSSADLDRTQVLEDAQHRVRSMALVHDELYRSGSIAEVDLRSYFERLSAYLCQSYLVGGRHRVVYRHADQVQVDADTAMPCGLIFTELLTNAFKHGYRDDRSGTIVVDLRLLPDDSCTLTVTDDGVGVPLGVASASSIFNASVLDSQASTLGLRLVQVLTRQLGGTFLLTRKDPGTEAILEFPVARLVRT